MRMVFEKEHFRGVISSMSFGEGGGGGGRDAGEDSSLYPELRLKDIDPIALSGLGDGAERSDLKLCGR